MPIKPRGGSFQVTVGSGENRYRKMFQDELEAQQAELDEIKRRKTEGATKVPLQVSKKPHEGKTLGEAYDLTMRLHWRGTAAEVTHKINSNAVLEFLGRDTPLTSITMEMVNEMVFEFEDQGNAGSTVNKKGSCLRMMFKTAQEQGWIEDFPNPPFRKEAKHRLRWLDEAEEVRVLAACEHLGLADLRDFIMVAIDTGFRRGEMLGFRPADFSNGLLHLHAGQTKTDEARAVPATRRVTEVLTRRAHLPFTFSPLSVYALRAQWEALREHLKLTDDPQFVVHMLRHTCASRLVQRGVPLAMVQKWMGHKKIETTLRYAHLAPNSLLMGKEALEQAYIPPTLTNNWRTHEDTHA
ncbi:tyrosine-type recombinase/integrase [Pseudoduganella lutea]|uniref:Site-specific integrase n=1 Tax=Pseudoduganella lutea TaxID=321985 RepID=A0A4P6L5C8_9BURK|nr:site-specific integrase [Pseudoduganella lutea]QBE66861.1 site-specific integrase [Pseudoduganella lutea]